MKVKIIQTDADLAQEKVNAFLRKLELTNLKVIAITQSSSGTLVTVMIQYE